MFLKVAVARYFAKICMQSMKQMVCKSSKSIITIDNYTASFKTNGLPAKVNPPIEYLL